MNLASISGRELQEQHRPDAAPGAGARRSTIRECGPEPAGARIAGASTVDALHESGGNAAARGQLDFAMAAIGNLYPAPQAAAGPRPVRTAFSLLRFSLLANLDLHG